MMEPLSTQDLILIAAGLLVLLLLSRMFSRVKRVNPLVALAKKLDFSLQEEHDYVLEHSLRDFRFTGLGRVFPKLFYVLGRFQDGVRTKVFDYNGSYSGRLLPHMLFQTMGYTEEVGRSFSYFFIAPRTLYWRLVSALGKENFFKNGVPPKFLEKFVVLPEKGKAAPRLKQEFFEAYLALGKPYSLEARGSRFIFYYRNTIIPVRRLSVFCRDFQAVSDALRSGIVSG